MEAFRGPAFNGIFSIYHLPVVLDFLKQSGMLHSAFNVLLFALALLMFYPIFNRVEPQERHMGGLFKLLYALSSGVLDGLTGQGLISGPEYFTNTTPIMDQQTGGIIMKVLQEVFFGFMLGYIFFNWYRNERKDEDEVTRRSVEEARLQKELFNQYR